MATDKTMIIAQQADIVFIAGTDIGFTLGGVEITQEIEVFEVEADQSNSVLQTTLINKIWRIKIPLTEGSLANLATVFTATSGNNPTSSELYFDVNDYPAGVTVGFVTKNLNGDVIRWFWHECQVESFDPITINKGTQAVYAATFRAFPKSGASQPGYVYRQIA